MRKLASILSLLAVSALAMIIHSCSEVEELITPNEPLPCESYILNKIAIEASAPRCINVLFRVVDSETERGVAGLTESDFVVMENDVPVGSEAGVTIVPNNQIPYSIKTVLLLDVSKSVENELEEIKQSAIAMVEGKDPKQEIAVYIFSSNTTLVQEFSTDKAEIINSIRSISLGTSSTNLYGAVVNVSNLYVEETKFEEQGSYIRTGNIVVFTDGDDTQGSVQLSQAVSSVSNKDVYVVVLESEDFLNSPNAESNLQSIQTRGLFKSSNISQLEGVFQNIQQEILLLARSTYWLYFESPKRGPNVHELNLSFACRGDNFSLITGAYNSATFSDFGSCDPTNEGGPASPKYNCVNGDCQEVVNGPYSSLSECQNNCSSELTVTDIDGNEYKAIKIGSQYWMAENLKVNNYNDGTQIPHVSSEGTQWGDLEEGAYTWYDDNPANEGEYGKLYNWFAVNTGKLCPSGWHIPTDAEWNTLAEFLGGQDVAGGKMKNITGWNAPNTGVTNTSGFSGLPGGVLSIGSNDYGFFQYLGELGDWWSSDDAETGNVSAVYYALRYERVNLIRGVIDKNLGFSCRCIKD